MGNRAANIRAVRRDPAEFTDRQIEQLIAFGRREAELIRQLARAYRNGDKEAAWQLAGEAAELEVEVDRDVPPEAA
jgi:hypothetical protein